MITEGKQGDDLYSYIMSEFIQYIARNISLLIFSCVSMKLGMQMAVRWLGMIQNLFFMGFIAFSLKFPERQTYSRGINSLFSTQKHFKKPIYSFV